MRWSLGSALLNVICFQTRIKHRSPSRRSPSQFLLLAGASVDMEMWGSLQAKLHPDIQAWVWPGLSLVVTTVPTGGPNIQVECSARVNVMRKGAPEDALVITLESHRVSQDLFTRGLRSHKHDVCQQKGTSFA